MADDKTDQRQKQSDRSWRTQSLGSLLPKVARPVLGRHGLAAGGIVADWPSIVGAQLADCCVPMRLAFPPGERTDGRGRVLNDALRPAGKGQPEALTGQLFAGYGSLLPP